MEPIPIHSNERRGRKKPPQQDDASLRDIFADMVLDKITPYLRQIVDQQIKTSPSTDQQNHYINLRQDFVGGGWTGLKAGMRILRHRIF